MTDYKSSFILNDKVSPALKAIVTNCRKMDRDLGKANKSLEIMQKKFENISKLGNKIKDIGKGLTVGVTLPVIAAGGAMVKLASDMEETINKVDVSFGKSSDTVKEWAKNSITSMGLAQQSALDSAALYGDMATGMGMAQDKAADMAMSLTQLGADLASFKNISNDMAQTALKSIFTGETESLKNLGIVMTENNLTRFAASQGIKKQMKDMSDLEKIQLRYNYVMSQTVNAQGDFIRTGGGAANQTRMFQEQMKEIGVTFGQYILPYFTKVIMKLNDMLKAFNSLSPGAKKTILVIGAIAAAIGPLLIVLGSMITAVASLNKALLWLGANPVALTIIAIVAAIAALTAVVVYCWNKFEGFRKMLLAVWSVIKLLGSIIRLVFVAHFQYSINVIQNVISWFSSLRETVSGLPAPIQNLGKVLFGALFVPLKAIWDIIQLVISGLQKVGGFRGLGDKIKTYADAARGNIDNTTNNITNNTNSGNTNTTNNTYNTTNNYNSLLPMAQYGI